MPTRLAQVGAPHSQLPNHGHFDDVASGRKTVIARRAGRVVQMCLPHADPSASEHTLMGRRTGLLVAAAIIAGSAALAVVLVSLKPEAERREPPSRIPFVETVSDGTAISGGEANTILRDRILAGLTAAEPELTYFIRRRTAAANRVPGRPVSRRQRPCPRKVGATLVRPSLIRRISGEDTPLVESKQEEWQRSRQR